MPERARWEDSWMSIADSIALRSPCDRRQIGAVIVSPTNRIIATGYNGFPSKLLIPNPPGRLIGGRGTTPTCSGDCPRCQPDAAPGIGYDDCITIHAEANALMFCDRQAREGGSLYVTSAVCWACAKQVANSGIEHVTMRLSSSKDAHRNPMKAVDLLRGSAISVRIIAVD